MRGEDDDGDAHSLGSASHNKSRRGGGGSTTALETVPELPLSSRTPQIERIKRVWGAPKMELRQEMATLDDTYGFYVRASHAIEQPTTV